MLEASEQLHKKEMAEMNEKLSALYDEFMREKR